MTINIDYVKLTHEGTERWEFAETVMDDDSIIGEAAQLALAVMGEYWDSRPWEYDRQYSEEEWVAAQVDGIIACLTRWKKEYLACKRTLEAEEVVRRAVVTGNYNNRDFASAAAVLTKGNSIPFTDLFRSCIRVQEEADVPADEHQRVG